MAGTNSDRNKKWRERYFVGTNRINKNSKLKGSKPGQNTGISRNSGKIPNQASRQVIVPCRLCRSPQALCQLDILLPHLSEGPNPALRGCSSSPPHEPVHLLYRVPETTWRSWTSCPYIYGSIHWQLLGEPITRSFSNAVNSLLAIVQLAFSVGVITSSSLLSISLLDSSTKTTVHLSIMSCIILTTNFLEALLILCHQTRTYNLCFQTKKGIK